MKGGGDWMEKDVLLPVRPRWVQLIAMGVKTLEIRKSRPTENGPFRVWIYCSRSKARTGQ